VIWNEELFFVPATSFTLNNVAVAVISTSYVVGANADPVLMTDGVSRNVHAIRTIEIVDGSNATPNYVADLTDFIYGDGKSLLEEHDYTITISTTSPNNTTLHTQTMGVAGQVWFLFDNQLTPASGSGQPQPYVINFEILKNGSSQVTKSLGVTSDGAKRDFTIQKVIDVKVGDTIVFRANNSINASVGVVGRLVVQANKVSI
jgi:hypothetical protein